MAELINESLAWGRVVIPYTTVSASHIFSFHCAAMDTNGNWDTPYSGEDTVFETATFLLNLMAAFFPTGTGFQPLVVYKNHLSPTPTEFWLTDDFTAPATAPSADQNPAHTLTLNLVTSKNRRVKYVVADTSGGYPVPALALPSSFVTVQNTLFAYLIANPNIVTIDGEKANSARSISTTMNDVLARKYGIEANTYE